MKRIFTSIFFASTLFAAYAQNLPNGGFEQWVPSGKDAPFNWEEPLGWKSINAQTEWSTAGTKKSSAEKQSGTYSVQLKSLMISGGWYSMICNGNPAPVNDFSAPSLNIITGGTPVSSKPVQLSGYYKFSSQTAGDSAFAVVILKKYNANLNAWDTVAYAEKSLPPVQEFSQFTMPLHYRTLTVDADSAVVAFYSSHPERPAKPADFTKTGELYIDEVALNTSTSVKPAPKTSGVFLYPNPVSHVLFITLNKEMAGAKGRYQLISADGKVAKQGELPSEMRTFSLDVAQVATGNYWFSVENEAGATFSSQVTITH